MHAPAKRLQSVSTAIIAAVLAAGGCWKVDADLLLSARELNFGTARTETSIEVTNDSADKALTSGMTALDYTFTCDRAWVTVSPSEGHLDGQQSATHTVSIDRGELADGENVAAIRVTSNGGNENIAVIAFGGNSGCSGAPSSPSSPAPDDGASGVSLSPTLSWHGGDSQCDQLTATYDIYFGTSSPAPFHHDNGTAKSWDPGPLDPDRTYYWRVVAKDANGSASGGEHSFHTLSCTENVTAPCNPSPPDGEDRVSTKADLSWGCGAESVDGCDESNDVSYVVYLGTSAGLDEADRLGTTTSRSWKLDTLRKRATYYWKVVASSSTESKSSPVWSFKTR